MGLLLDAIPTVLDLEEEVRLLWLKVVSVAEKVGVLFGEDMFGEVCFWTE